MDESSGNAVDSSGNGNTLTNNGTVTYSTGKIMNGAYFNGSSNYFSISSTNFNPSGDFSIAFWVKVNSTASDYVVLGQDVLADRQLYIRLSYSGNQIQATVNDSFTVNSSTNPNTFGTGTYFHVVFVFVASGTSVLYVNGASDGTTGSSPAAKGTSSGALNIGRRAFITAEQYLNGSIDEIGWWGRALTAGEVTTLYNGGVGFSYPFVVTSGNFLAFI